MLHWFGQVLLTLLAAGVGAYTVGPRINARVKNVEAMHDARREFKRRLLMIYVTCQRLDTVDLTTGDEAVDKRIADERRRWLDQLDDHTKWLVDNVEFYVLGYVPLAGARKTIARYAMIVRMTLLSSKPEGEQIKAVSEMTGLMLEVVDPNRLRPTAWKPAMDQLIEKMDKLQGE